jgi:general secretion pathway protein E
MPKPHGVGDALVEAGELTVRRLGRASTWQRQHGGTIERALLTTGAISEEVLAAALTRTYSLAAATRKDLAAADPDVVASLSAKERKRLRALPFQHMGKVLHVAVSDPRNAVLGRLLSAATGFTVKLFVTPDPVLEDFLDWFEKGAPPPPPPRIGPTQEKRPATDSAAMPGVLPDSIDKLGRALLGEALRFGATELTLGSDARGAFVRTFYASHPALTRRLSGALLGPLISWFESRCRKDGGFLVEFARPGELPDRRRVELLGSSPQEARLHLAPVSAPLATVKAEDLTCLHVIRPGDIFCSRCGAVL